MRRNGFCVAQRMRNNGFPLLRKVSVGILVVKGFSSTATAAAASTRTAASTQGPDAGATVRPYS